MPERSLVFIDAENILHAWRKYCEQQGKNVKIDYAKLVKYLAKDTNLLRAYFYDGMPPNATIEKRKFHEALQHQGIQLRTKILRNKSETCPPGHDSQSGRIPPGPWEW